MICALENAKKIIINPKSRGCGLKTSEKNLARSFFSMRLDHSASNFYLRLPNFISNLYFSLIQVSCKFGELQTIAWGCRGQNVFSNNSSVFKNDVKNGFIRFTFDLVEVRSLQLLKIFSKKNDAKLSIHSENVIKNAVK